MRRVDTTALLLLALAGPAAAQTEWRRLLVLPPGQPLTVHLHDGTLREGRLEEISGAGMTLSDPARGRTDIARKDVARVTRKSRLKGALWAGLAAFAVAAPAGAWAGRPLNSEWTDPSRIVRARHAAAWGFLFGGIGAGVGAGKGMESTLYRAASQHAGGAR